ncbi:MAG TPA: thioredoxin domain-containing protein [Candidatus Paceibacterota bacterium]
MSEEVTTAAPSAQAKAASKIELRDLLIPLSIVVAGICVGLGLYFNGPTGGANLPANQVGQNGQEQPAAGDTSKVDPVTEADHIKGNLSAPVKIVEYSDFECPFCKRHHETLLSIVEEYGDQVAWVYRQFPLEQLHKKAMPVAMASECVAELGGNDAFWTFTDRYFEETLTNDRTDIETVIPMLVAEAGVNKAKFTECFESNRHEVAIQADMSDAVETGGRGTPWGIIIGPNGKTYPVNGAQPASVIKQMIETALEEA